MTKLKMHFAHANSYPAGTYRLFFEHLRQYYDVQSLDIHAHNPRYPVRNGWHELMLELIDELLEFVSLYCALTDQRHDNPAEVFFAIVHLQLFSASAGPSGY